MSINIKSVKLWKTGTSFVFSVPKAFIDNGQVDVSKNYDVELTEVVLDGNKKRF